MDIKQLKERIWNKREDLRFWTELMSDVDYPLKRAKIEGEIREFERELKEEVEKINGTNNLYRGL